MTFINGGNDCCQGEELAMFAEGGGVLYNIESIFWFNNLFSKSVNFVLLILRWAISWKAT